MLLIEKEFNGDMTETAKKLEGEIASIAEKIVTLEGKMLVLLPCPVPHCKHNIKTYLNPKNKPSKKRPAEQIAGPSKTTTSVANSPENQLNEFESPVKLQKLRLIQRRM
ncbi:hypothetical protein TNCT_500871 [Trichonephila clavata]|uniref:Uncharacterized protein n=1 Tax=Trichonephila clavata TaxID=2740835 RepID=A0A8X6I986_TRICU|nr:hypothetical protein TNCT_500871 [Trichonephila clavata]